MENNQNEQLTEMEEVDAMEEMEESEQQKTQRELMKEKVKEVRNQEKEYLKAWLKKTDTKLPQSDCYFESDNYVRMVSQGASYGCIVSGVGGIGKTYRSTAILAEENADYVYTDSYSTPAAFYVWMYKNREKVLLLDDVAGLLEDKRGNAYLKAALWEVNGERMVHNLTMKPLKDEDDSPVPNNFPFTGGVIILTNSLNTDNPHIKALLTRVNFAELDIPYKERMRIIEEIALKPYGSLTDEERKSVLAFIKENCSEAVADLNLRTLIKLYQFYEFSKKNDRGDLWKRLGMNLLKKNDKLLIVEELEKDQNFPQVEQKIAEFVKLTEESRSQYFRYKKVLEQRKGNK